MPTQIEKEETDKDADSLILPITAYLEALDAAIKTYGLDQPEFTKIKERLNADYNALSSIFGKVSDHFTYLSTLNTRKTEALTFIDAAIKQRKA
jgi:hypothetical protein